MRNKLIALVIIAALFIGGRKFLESEGERTVRVAQEMYEDKKYDDALKVLRSKERWFGWTEAYKDSEPLRKKIRKRSVAVKERAKANAEAKRLDAEGEAERRQREQDAARQEALDRNREAVERSLQPSGRKRN